MTFFHWSLIDFKSPQINQESSQYLIMLLSWWSLLVLLFQCLPVPFTKLLGSVPGTSITINNTVTFMFHRFYFNSLARSGYLTLYFCFLLFYSVIHWDDKVHYSFNFLLTIIRSSFLADIEQSVSISKSQRISSVSFSMTDSGFCIYHFLGWNFNFLPNLCVVL